MGDATAVGHPGARLLIRLSRIIPPALAWWLGAAVGDALAHLPLRDVRRCRGHLAIAFPERGEAWAARTTRATFRHFGGMALWMAASLDRDPHRWRRGVMVEGAEHVRATARACRRGEGTLGFSGHLGNWELLARLASTILPVTVIGRRMRSSFGEALVGHLRTAHGARLIRQDDDMRTALRDLREGRIVATLPDQDIPRLSGAFVPWFGRPAHTPTGPAQLALLARVQVQPVFMLRRGRRWVFHMGPRVAFPRSADRAGDAAAITAWAMAYEEALVRRVPEQWVWWHKRWRTRPPAVIACPESGVGCPGSGAIPISR